jgi:glutamate-1-semialdehyde 2,1-aminomutase
MEVNVLAIIQARMGSTRLPGKVLKKIKNKNLLDILLSRLSLSKEIDKIVIATSENKINDPLQDFVLKKGFEVFRGDEEDVLSRYYQTAKIYNPQIIVRITGDCPLIDYQIVDEIIKVYKNGNYDYVSNTIKPTFPDGLDVEVFSIRALELANKEAKTSYEREHVTPFIKNNNFLKSVNYKNKKDYSSERWTVDNPEDLVVLKNIINYFWPNIFFSWTQILKLKKESPHLFTENNQIKRNQGSKMNKGQKLYSRAKKIIPGGTMLLSKRPEMFLPENWPSYFQKSKGCKVWDLDGKEYTDMSIMGIGTNILGYGNEEVDDAVRSTISKGNMSTLNCPEEVFLAEKLIELHPWSKMVRFARSGGEANSIAIRIARAASGKDKVAICGYHGWHDWYLATNLKNEKGLDNHLLPGLSVKGIPKALSGTVFPFEYNNFESLENIIKANDIGTIKMEVSRNFAPKKGFLEAVRRIADENNIILIFDECTSGFRETFGGLHKKYDIIPDMMMLGKALGNGYAITAVIGKEEVMRSCQETFISSTFWTERIGPSAALKTLEVMQKEKSWEKITNIGRKVEKKWIDLGNKYGLKIITSGLPALINFSIDSKDWLKYKTFITQEMLKKGYLASDAVYACTMHSNAVLEGYFKNIEQVFMNISKSEKDKNIDELLDGPTCHSGFGRLN